MFQNRDSALRLAHLEPAHPLEQASLGTQTCSKDVRRVPTTKAIRQKSTPMVIGSAHMTLCDLMMQTRFPSSAYRVWEAIAAEGSNIAEIRARTHLSLSSVRIALNLLMATGHVVRSRRARSGRGPTTEYTFMREA